MSLIVFVFRGGAVYPIPPPPVFASCIVKFRINYSSFARQVWYIVIISRISVKWSWHICACSCISSHLPKYILYMKILTLSIKNYIVYPMPYLEHKNTCAGIIITRDSVFHIIIKRYLAVGLEGLWGGVVYYQ